MFISHVESVLEVHLKCVTPPTEAIFDERRQKLSPMKEIGSGDPNRVCAPFRDSRVALFEVIHCTGDGLKPRGVEGTGDE